MKDIKLSGSELKLMELLWEAAPVSAAELHRLAAEKIGWNKNTTYTILKKLVEKNAVSRTDPGFACETLVTKEEVRKMETRTLIDKLYDGSKKSFFAAFLHDEALSEQDIQELKEMIEKK